jgi:hypothetical protein
MGSGPSSFGSRLPTCSSRPAPAVDDAAHDRQQYEETAEGASRHWTSVHSGVEPIPGRASPGWTRPENRPKARFRGRGWNSVIISMRSPTRRSAWSASVFLVRLCRSSVSRARFRSSGSSASSIWSRRTGHILVGDLAGAGQQAGLRLDEASTAFAWGELQKVSTIRMLCCATAVPITRGDAPIIADGFCAKKFILQVARPSRWRSSAARDGGQPCLRRRSSPKAAAQVLTDAATDLDITCTACGTSSPPLRSNDARSTCQQSMLSGTGGAAPRAWCRPNGCGYRATRCVTAARSAHVLKHPVKRQTGQRRSPESRGDSSRKTSALRNDPARSRTSTRGSHHERGTPVL